MKHRSQQAIITGDRHRALAIHLFTNADAPEARVEWTSVIAFYAAVQYINAALFERLDFVPGTHAEREAAIERITELRGIAGDYYSLKAAASGVRYIPGFRVARQDADDLITNSLPVIRMVVTALTANRQ